jgi:cytochrome c556
MMKPYLQLGFAVLFMTSACFAETDTREKVEFPEMMQQHMLANMRDHLLAINEIQAFLAVTEYEKAAEVAEQRLGMSSLDNHGAAHMASMMPQAMQAMGTNMHKAASQFAITVVETSVSGDLKPALGALSKITQQCVACHQAYRVH